MARDSYHFEFARGLATLLALIVAPNLTDVPVVDLLSLQSYVITAEQILIGVSMAFLIQIMFQIFILAGQMIAMQMGLGFASMVDPGNGVSVAIISQFYLMLTSLMFMAMNGHLIAFEVLVESFYVLPVSAEWRFNGMIKVAEVGTWLFRKRAICGASRSHCNTHYQFCIRCHDSGRTPAECFYAWLSFYHVDGSDHHVDRPIRFFASVSITCFRGALYAQGHLQVKHIQEEIGEVNG